MKIFGIGTDIVNIKRIEHSLKKHKFTFKNKIFSKKEISYCEKRKNPSAFYAKRFAAKEAFSKALGTGIRKGVNFKDIDILNDKKGKPLIKISTNVRKFLKKKFKLNRYKIFLSLSDEKDHSIAYVIINKLK